jgi:hypothetical protein
MAKEKSRRKIVWVLGAGASRGAGAVTSVQHGGTIPIPMQSDFWDTTLRFADNDDRKLIEAFLFKYFKGYRKTSPKVKPSERRKFFGEVSVEEVFTFLSERISSATISPQLRTYYHEKVWEPLIRSVTATFRRFKSNTNTLSVYRVFADNHLKSRDAIISFNYDTVFESSLRKIEWYYFGFKKKNIPIYKPHGSINWGLKPDHTIKTDKQTTTPVIVAPTHLKFIGLNGFEDKHTSGYLNSNKTINEIWQAMEKQMEGAKAIVFIGYSFPDADLYFSSVLRTVLTKSQYQIKIILVNPDSLRISEKISSRFSIKRTNIYNHFDLESFCKLKRNEILRAK